MKPEETNPRENTAETIKQNEDLPNLPAATEKIDNEDHVKKEIKKTSKLNDEGKTDNTEINSEN